jgi:1-deoxy-D-xylulose-5-phosphate synthase
MPYGPVDVFDENVIKESDLSFSQPQVVSSGKDMVMITVGNKYSTAIHAVQQLRDKGIDCGLVNLRYLKPLHADQLSGLMSQVPRVVSLEEAVLDGGIGNSLAALILDRKLKCELLRIGIPCRFIEPGSVDELSRKYGLDTDGVLRSIKNRWHI